MIKISPRSDELDENDDRSTLTTKQKSLKKFITVCSCCGLFTGFRMRRPVYIIGLVTIILSLLLIGIVLALFVIVPSIIRSTISNAVLNFNSIRIEQIQNDSFHLRAQLELSRTGSISASIIAPLKINVNDVGEIVNNQTIEITGGSNATVVPVDSQFTIKNMTSFQQFVRSLVFERNVTWHLAAMASVQPLGSFMPTYSNIPFNKDVILNALNGLSNVTVCSIYFNRSDDHHILTDITINIQNPSIFTVDLGELQLDLIYNNQRVGYVRSTNQNITLVPGENMIPFTGELQTNSTESYASLLTVIQHFLTNQTSQIQTLAGPHATSYPLLAPSMNGLMLNVELPPFNQSVISSLVFQSISLVPSTIDKSVSLSASIVIEINTPLGYRSPLTIQTMDLNALLAYNGSYVGKFTVSQIPVQQINVTTYQTGFTDQSLILMGTGVDYEQFSRDFIKASTEHPIEFQIFGTASIIGGFALGPLSVDGILVSNNVALAGLNGLSEVVVHGISIEGEESRGLRLSIDATINDPGIAVVELRNFIFQLLDAVTGVTLGEVLIDDLDVSPGANDVKLHGFVAPKNDSDLPVLSRFFSAYLSGKTQLVRLFHDQSTLANATAMDLTVSGLKIEADLNGISANLIRHVSVLEFGIYFSPDDPNRVYVSGRLEALFVLPPNVDMNFKVLSIGIDLLVRSINGSDIGQVNLQNIPAKHNQTTNEILVEFDQQEFHVIDSDAFQQFAADLVLTKNVSMIIQGSVVAVCNLSIGVLTLTDIPLSQTISLVGYNQFDGGLLSIKHIDILGSLTKDQLMLSVTTNIDNPSVVFMLNGGRLSLELSDADKSHSFGFISIEPFRLYPFGQPTIAEGDGIFSVTQENNQTVRDFISRMVSGLNNTVQLTGILADNSTGTSVPLLEKAVAGLHVHTVIPGLSGDQCLVQEIILKKLTASEIVAIGLGFLKTIQTRIRLINPFNTTFTIHKMQIRADDSTIVDEKKQIGVVNDATEFLLHPNSELITSYVEVHLTGEKTTLASLIIPLFSGNARLSLSGTVDATIGDEFSLIQLPITVENVKTDQEKSQTI